MNTPNPALGIRPATENELTRDTQPKLVALLSSVTERAADTILQETRLVEDLDLDSLAMLEIIVFLEEEFGIEVEDELREAVRDSEGELSTVGQLISFVNQRRADAVNG